MFFIKKWKLERQLAAVEKELLLVQKEESKIRESALKVRSAGWKTILEAKIPPKAFEGLKAAFSKGFSAVFIHGQAIIELSYRKNKIAEKHSLNDLAVKNKGRRKELKRIYKGAQKSNLFNLTVTTVEGIGLGALGIGMPDIVLFIATLLKGIYETALSFGYDYNTKLEQFIILKMMATSLMSGEEWKKSDSEIDKLMQLTPRAVSDELFNKQIEETASAFALDMLLLKFIQGLPVVGVLGGAANPIYYNKIMKYIQIKYRKRYLQKQYTEIISKLEKG
ncbi:MAG: EcsC family protein [Oscillospiraceae bacterium]|nr:EcsC family protein [Oscillospiraceae bacterium]